MQKKTIIWSSVVSLIVIILGSIIIQVEPQEFSILLSDGSIEEGD